ncbi:zinc dependent phospholipase C family protein [Clostridium paridis]|uniref:Zinc dependent phospholipase C family protein n=1 Tax=Clostridium paridis TaxID=2803863 RepID=A0A937FDN5_9CLOT|nr:zinc dependent phospholipase C family protein [Clostridium paridis]MBL4932105.1 hypothetical protein [Clostridium paridis]
MGSLMMHYCIFNELSKSLKVNKNRFLMGMLSTDISHLAKEPKNKSHFMTVDENGVRFVNYYDFYKKYKLKFSDCYFLGYFCHLISDDIWHNLRPTMEVNILPPEERSTAKIKYLNDLRQLNSVIVNTYKLENNIPNIGKLEVDDVMKSVEIDEININLLPQILTQASQYFEANPQISNKPLEIFTVDEINEYINNSVTISLEKLAEIAN